MPRFALATAVLIALLVLGFVIGARYFGRLPKDQPVPVGVHPELLPAPAEGQPPPHVPPPLPP